jgi:hypothetical protein
LSLSSLSPEAAGVHTDSKAWADTDIDRNGLEPATKIVKMIRVRYFKLKTDAPGSPETGRYYADRFSEANVIVPVRREHGPDQAH